MQLLCSICCLPFNSSDRKPLIICRFNHTFCACCCQSFSSCPECREKIFAEINPNYALLNFIESYSQGFFCQEIPPNELIVSSPSTEVNTSTRTKTLPCQWLDSDAICKVYEIASPADQSFIQQYVHQSSLLNLPSLIRCFGLSHLDSSHTAIVMEKASHSLPVPSSLSTDTLANAINICKILTVLHSKDLCHGNLKPQNILFVNGRLVLSDCDFFLNSRYKVNSKYSTSEVIGVDVEQGFVPTRSRRDHHVLEEIMEGGM
ncbi:hypothetical protein GEMRC1_010641 [Eukaryota sp. GEM-RC1]